MAPVRRLFDGMPPPTLMVDDPDYMAFMENVIFEGPGIPIFGSLQGPSQGQVVYSHTLFELIKDCPKFKDQYAARKKKGGKAVKADEGDFLKRPRGNTSSKPAEKRDVDSIALEGTLENMMSQKKVMEERRSKVKEEKMKIYLDLQTKKLEKEEVVKRRKLVIGEATQIEKLEIDATNAETK
ncbi:Receptor-like protein kinase HSL1 [Hordeum vulgare]|nr:Receptor-like protein kinase HSL1 [Hordeum vulgare]